MLGPCGVAVYNLCAKKPAFFAVCRRQFAGVFAQVHGMQTEDVNQMFLLTDRAVLTTKEAADAQRTEETKALLPDFVFTRPFRLFVTVSSVSDITPAFDDITRLSI